MAGQRVQTPKYGSFDLLSLPLVGRFLRWRHASTAMRLGMLLIAVVMIVHGIAGPQLAPKNLATVLTWLHFRGLLVLGLLLAGNVFCMACPFILVRDLARRVFRLDHPWPRPLRRKWPAVVLFFLLLFAYELFDLWGDPLWTVLLIFLYFVGATIFGVVFRGAPFCGAICPLGQFNLVSSLVSPLEVKIGDPETCATCPTRDCIRGRGAPGSASRKALPGCELGLFQARKVGNMNCHFRLDCLRACPYDNVGIQARLPASELWGDPWRSGIGYLSRRRDIAALIVVYTFGALLNAFGMVSPVYALQSWLAAGLGLPPEGGLLTEAPVLAILFIVGLGVIPLVLLALAGWLTRVSTARSEPLLPLINRYVFALVPMGFGVWLAHFAFHFLTGVLTIVPVVESTLADIGVLPGIVPRWYLGPIFPTAWVDPIELGLLGLGWMGSLLVAYRLAERDAPERRWWAFLPWAVLITLVLIAAIWLMSQPMEMRGTIFAG